jgi:hypothetical protein
MHPGGSAIDGLVRPRRSWPPLLRLCAALIAAAALVVVAATPSLVDAIDSVFLTSRSAAPATAVHTTRRHGRPTLEQRVTHDDKSALRVATAANMPLAVAILTAGALAYLLAKANACAGAARRRHGCSGMIAVPDDQWRGTLDAARAPPVLSRARTSRHPARRMPLPDHWSAPRSEEHVGRPVLAARRGGALLRALAP